MSAEKQADVQDVPSSPFRREAPSMLDVRPTQFRRLSVPLPHQGSAQLIVMQDQLTGDLPTSVLRSKDWRLRLDLSTDSGVWVGDMNSPRYEKRFQYLVAQRLRFLRPWGRPIPDDWTMDLAYSRSVYEDAYCSLLSNKRVQSIVERDGPGANAELFMLTTPLVDVSRLACNGRVDLQWREFERKQRHRLGVLVPAQCQEAAMYRAEHAALRLPKCPPWWKLVEEPYCGRSELPPVISYLGTELTKWEDSSY